ncbi:hypothetical protein [Streptomyces sp. NRRL B-24484]|uniref:hypothetical protein n=1 Tax=Streptomyces sp. NRRL B-24484 TaxID=1463833 RepID=UPI0004BF5986|nr:hypothetical protein [Streptomyces sp. NRRL B-24484]
MGSITALVEGMSGPAFDAFRYPYAYAEDLLREREIVPRDHLYAAEQEIRAQMRTDSKKRPDWRVVCMTALRQWCEQEGEDLETVVRLLADRYLEFHAIAKA